MKNVTYKNFENYQCFKQVNKIVKYEVKTGVYEAFQRK